MTATNDLPEGAGNRRHIGNLLPPSCASVPRLKPQEPPRFLRSYFSHAQYGAPDPAEAKLRAKISKARSTGYRRVVLTLNEADDLLARLDVRG